MKESKSSEGVMDDVEEPTENEVKDSNLRDLDEYNDTRVRVSEKIRSVLDRHYTKQVDGRYDIRSKEKFLEEVGGTLMNTFDIYQKDK